MRQAIFWILLICAPTMAVPPLPLADGLVYRAFDEVDDWAELEHFYDGVIQRQPIIALYDHRPRIYSLSPGSDAPQWSRIISSGGSYVDVTSRADTRVNTADVRKVIAGYTILHNFQPYNNVPYGQMQATGACDGEVLSYNATTLETDPGGFVTLGGQLRFDTEQFQWDGFFGHYTGQVSAVAYANPTAEDSGQYKGNWYQANWYPALAKWYITGAYWTSAGGVYHKENISLELDGWQQSESWNFQEQVPSSSVFISWSKSVGSASSEARHPPGTSIDDKVMIQRKATGEAKFWVLP